MATRQAAPAIELTGTGLAPGDVVAVARGDAPVALSAAAHDAMAASAAIVAALADSNTPAYGVTTGFGSLANTWIPEGRRGELQRALVRSHATGMGPPVEREVVRAMMLLRARSSIIARTTSRSTGGPMPVACDRTSARCSSPRRPSGIQVLASEPKPVVTP